MQRKRKNINSFAKTLSNILDEKHLGVREAARMAGVGPSTIMSWRSGALPEDYFAVKKLAKALGTTMSFLLTGENDSRPEGAPLISEVFELGDELFDGYAKITIQRLVPKNKKGETK
ncbi:MAG: helix-turn-helix domain-containing protein [Pseudobdellovibrionaceae bacterium]